MQKYAHEHTLLLLDDASIEVIRAKLESTNGTTEIPSMAIDLNDLYASMVLNRYLKIQGACSLKGTLHDRENSTISAYYSRGKLLSAGPSNQGGRVRRKTFHKRGRGLLSDWKT